MPEANWKNTPPPSKEWILLSRYWNQKYREDPAPQATKQAILEEVMQERLCYRCRDPVTLKLVECPADLWAHRIDWQRSLVTVTVPPPPRPPDPIPYYRRLPPPEETYIRVYVEVLVDQPVKAAALLVEPEVPAALVEPKISATGRYVQGIAPGLKGKLKKNAKQRDFAEIIFKELDRRRREGLLPEGIKAGRGYIESSLRSWKLWPPDVIG